MTTEADEDKFQAALDANPEDYHTRLVFADWLEERDDPRAEGYRVMGVQRLRHGSSESFLCWWGVEKNKSAFPEQPFAALPDDWFSKLTRNPWWSDHKNRREAEDAAALAFAKLPLDRRLELLSSSVPA